MRFGAPSAAVKTQAPMSSMRVTNVLPEGAAGSAPQPRSRALDEVATSSAPSLASGTTAAAAGRASLKMQAHASSRCAT